jgi:hypothetical protein
VRILIANAYQPMRGDHAEELAAGLTTALIERGHTAERVRLPFAHDRERLVEQMLALRLAEISDVGELMITIGMPAHLLRHHRKIVWLEVGESEYCTWGAERPNLPLDQQGDLLRAAVIRADRLAIREAARIFAGSAALRRRVRQQHRAAAEPLPASPSSAFDRDSWDAVVEALIR